MTSITPLQSRLHTVRADRHRSQSSCALQLSLFASAIPSAWELVVRTFASVSLAG